MPQGTPPITHSIAAAMQVIFRHGARTPLSNLYWPNTSWTHCSQQPLNASAAAAAAVAAAHSPPYGSRSSGSRVGASHFSSSSSKRVADTSGSSNSNASKGIQLQLYDPSGAPIPPELSGELPFPCTPYTHNHQTCVCAEMTTYKSHTLAGFIHIACALRRETSSFWQGQDLWGIGVTPHMHCIYPAYPVQQLGHISMLQPM
jgi:hypothetical protein